MFDRDNRWLRVPRLPFVPAVPNAVPPGRFAGAAQVALDVFDRATEAVAEAHDRVFAVIQGRDHSLGFWEILADRWRARIDEALHADPRYVELAAGRDAGTVGFLDYLTERSALIGELVPRPLWWQLRWASQDLAGAVTGTVRALLIAAGARSRGQYWFFTHEGLWQCPDCETYRSCDTTEDHACTAQIVGVDEIPDDLDVVCGYCDQRLPR